MGEPRLGHSGHPSCPSSKLGEFHPSAQLPQQLPELSTDPELRLELNEAWEEQRVPWDLSGVLRTAKRGSRKQNKEQKNSH